eukprot:SAG11_NODE_86_length_17300_cov_11.466717_15_plen_93_part_00
MREYQTSYNTSASPEHWTRKLTHLNEPVALPTTNGRDRSQSNRRFVLTSSAGTAPIESAFCFDFECWKYETLILPRQPLKQLGLLLPLSSSR